MLVQILNKLKNRNFWAGVATTVAGVLAGTLSAPEAVINFITNLIGGQNNGSKAQKIVQQTQNDQKSYNHAEKENNAQKKEKKLLGQVV